MRDAKRGSAFNVSAQSAKVPLVAPIHSQFRVKDFAGPLSTSTICCTVNRDRYSETALRTSRVSVPERIARESFSKDSRAMRKRALEGGLRIVSTLLLVGFIRKAPLRAPILSSSDRLARIGFPARDEQADASNSEMIDARLIARI